MQAHRHPFFISCTPLTGLLLGLVGAICIGASDCIARVTSQRVTLSILILCVMGVSTALLTVYLAIEGNFPVWHQRAWIASAVSGFLNVVALYFLYLALANGPVAVASPAASSFAVILVMLNAIAGQPWTWIQLLAVVVVFAGVAMLSRGSDDDPMQYSQAWLRKTVLLATAAAIAVSIRMFLAQVATDHIGASHALYLNRVFALVTCMVLIGWQLSKATTLQFPTGKTAQLVVLQSLFEMAALAAFLTGSLYGGRVAASIGFSAFAAATVIIARIFLKEPVGIYRGIWVTVIVAGVLLAAIGTP